MTLAPEMLAELGYELAAEDVIVRGVNRDRVRERILRHSVTSVDNLDSTIDSPHWLWAAQVDAYGYGKCTVRPWREQFAHRVAYVAWRGEIPEGLAIDHLCGVRHCVNPWHLEPVTTAENNRRMSVRRTHCKRGHEYTPENTAVYKQTRGVGTYRACRACRREHQRQYRSRRPS